MISAKLQPSISNMPTSWRVNHKAASSPTFKKFHPDLVGPSNRTGGYNQVTGLDNPRQEGFAEASRALGGDELKASMWKRVKMASTSDSRIVCLGCGCHTDRWERQRQAQGQHFGSVVRQDKILAPFGEPIAGPWGPVVWGNVKALIASDLTNIERNDDYSICLVSDEGGSWAFI